MGFKEYDAYDALGLAALVANGEVTPTELLDEAIDRAQRIDPQLNAIPLPDYDEARAAIDAGLPDGPFKGVPFLLKNLHLRLKGTVTTNGSAIFDGDVATYDSTLVTRFKQAGLVLYGKTNSPEFGLTGTTEPHLHGATRNPWNLEHSPGGSSGGGAAAVAAGLLPMANASDGGGSIRMPASCCGLFGMKPTRARNPSGPYRGEGWAGMSVNHAVSRSVRDSAALLDATFGTEPGAPYECADPARSYLSEVTTAPRQLRIAFNSTAPNGVETHPELVQAVENAAKLCEQLGHHVKQAAPQYDTQEAAIAQQAIIGANTAALLNARTAQLGRDLVQGDVENVTWRMVQGAKRVSAADYVAATHTIHSYGFMMARFHQDYDIYLCPTLAQPPVKLGVLDMMTDDMRTYATAVNAYMPYTALFNMTGQPSMSVPLHWSADGLPCGVMFTAPFGDEATLFQLAGQLEQASPWAHKRPPVHAGNGG